MKLLFLFGLLFLNTCTYSQSGVVPFRIGNLWGFSDTLGIIIQKPKYDRIYFPIEANTFGNHNLPSDCFVVQRDGLRGLFNTSEMIPPRFEKFYFDQFQCIGIKKNNEREHFQTNGKPLFNKTVKIEKELGTHYLEQGFFIYFLVSNEDKTKSLVAFSSKKPGKLIVLAKNIETAKALDNNTLQASFVVAFIGKEYEERLTFDVDATTGKIEPSNPKKPKKPKSYNIDTESILVEEYSSEPAYVSIQEPYYDDVVLSKESVFCSFILNKDSLCLQETLMDKRTGRKGFEKVQNIQLPKGSTQVKLIPYLTNNKQFVGDTLRYFRNYVQFKCNNKTGVICFNQLPPILFDTLEYFIDDQKNSGFFMVGNRNANDVLKLGIARDSGSFQIPMEYDRLTYNRNSLREGNNNISHSSIWLQVLKEGKAGIIRANNTLVVPIQYDAVLEPTKAHHQYRSNIIKSGDLYGWLYVNTYKNILAKPTIVEPFTSLLPYGLFILPKPPNTGIADFVLMRLIDAEGKIIGYADRNKRQYWKD